jgi:hypothetical protein
MDALHQLMWMLMRAAAFLVDGFFFSPGFCGATSSNLEDADTLSVSL